MPSVATATRVPPCQKCQAQDWSFDLTGIYCNTCLAFHEKHSPAEQRAMRLRGEMSLTAMLCEMRAGAVAIEPTSRELGEMWVDQVTWCDGQLARIGAALARNLDCAPPSEDSEWWLRYWRLEAKGRYVYETLALLMKRGHALACPSCPGTGPLSSLGLAIDGRAMSWARYCVEHAKDQIEAHGKRLHGLMGTAISHWEVA